MPDLQRRIAPARAFIVQLLEPLQLLLILFCITLLCAATVSTWADRLAAAATLMGIFLVSLMTLLLPRLKVLEAFGVKAELSEQIREAKVTIEQLKLLAQMSARQGFEQVARGSARYAPLPERQAFIESLNAGMRSADLTEDQAEELRRPFYDAIAEDLRRIVQLAFIYVISIAVRTTDAELKDLGPQSIGIPDPHELTRSDLRTRYERLTAAGPTWEAATSANLATVFDRQRLDFYEKTGKNDARLAALADTGLRLMEACLSAKTIVLEADQFIGSVPRHVPGYLHGDDGGKIEALLAGRFARST